MTDQEQISSQLEEILRLIVEIRKINADILRDLAETRRDLGLSLSKQAGDDDEG